MVYTSYQGVPSRLDSTLPQRQIKSIKVYLGAIRTCQEASEIIMKQQEGLGNTRPGRETILGWEGRLCRESRLSRETKLVREISLGLEGRL